MISAVLAGFMDGPAPPADEELSALSAAIDRFTEAASREDVPIERKVRLLRGATVARNRLDSVISNLTREVDEDSLRHVDGQAACARWLRDECRMSGSAAYAQVRLARQLPGLPDTAQAFAAGTLSAPHASAIARTVERVVRYGGSAREAEALMLQEAFRRDPTDLLRWGFGLRHRLCPDDLADEEEDQRERSWIDLIQNRDGSYSLCGELDKESGTIVKTAMHAVNGKRAKDDQRTHRQRRAAGLVELARYRLDAGDLPTRGGQRPHITVTTTLETLLGLPGADAAELDFGVPISGRSVRKMVLEGAELTPVTVDGKGNPLYVGRQYRGAPPKLKRALELRDRHCRAPGCTKPVEWCQGEHRIPYSEGGTTDIENMRLYCAGHNWLKAQGYGPERRTDGRIFWVEIRPPEGHDTG